jgi:hypothetical protein
VLPKLVYILHEAARQGGAALPAAGSGTGGDAPAPRRKQHRGGKKVQARRTAKQRWEAANGNKGEGPSSEDEGNDEDSGEAHEKPAKVVKLMPAKPKAASRAASGSAKDEDLEQPPAQGAKRVLLRPPPPSVPVQQQQQQFDRDAVQHSAPKGADSATTSKARPFRSQSQQKPPGNWYGDKPRTPSPSRRVSPFDKSSWSQQEWDAYERKHNTSSASGSDRSDGSSWGEWSSAGQRGQGSKEPWHGDKKEVKQYARKENSEKMQKQAVKQAKKDDDYKCNVGENNYWDRKSNKYTYNAKASDTDGPTLEQMGQASRGMARVLRYGEYKGKTIERVQGKFVSLEALPIILGMGAYRLRDIAARSASHNGDRFHLDTMGNGRVWLSAAYRTRFASR